MTAISKALGKPRYYKGIPVYPVKVKDIESFYDYIQCLLIPKNTFQDIKIVKMSYLAFLLELSSNQEYYIFLERLVGLLRMIFRTDNIQFDRDEKQKYIIIIDDIHIIRERDFDKLKTIISEQNLVDLDDEFVSPEVKKRIDEARAFMAKRANKMASLDQQIIAYHCEIRLSYYEIEELTIYQFNKGIERLDHIMSASAILSARYSGMVEFKDESKIPHWLSHIDDKKKDDLLLDANEFKNKATKELGMASL